MIVLTVLLGGLGIYVVVIANQGLLSKFAVGGMFVAFVAILLRVIYKQVGASRLFLDP
jgi:hypothetical protein